jgi:peptidoglycan/xylan/chitin deacetylase (PgdA/CDA1 family)
MSVSRLSAAMSRAFGGALSPAGPNARLAVFSYHQVLGQGDPLRPGEPDAGQFASDVAVIDRVFTVLPMQEAARRLKERTLPARAACITFDDGYANNFEVAAPILEAAGVQATFFVAGGAVDTGIMWNDLVIEAVARRRGRAFAFGALAGVTDSETMPDHVLAGRLLKQLKYEPVGRRWDLALSLFRDNAAAAEPPRLMMTRDMVAGLARKGFDVGGHTIHHPILKGMDDAAARDEIEGCSRWCVEVTGSQPKSFAYPNGKPGTDFAPRHERMVAAAGFDLAVSTDWSVAHAGTSVFSIPRIGPWWRQNRSLPGGLLRAYLPSRLRRAP